MKKRFAFIDSDSAEKLGYTAISACLKKQNYDVEVFCLPLEKDFYQAIEDFRPDFVGFGSVFGQEPDVIELFSNIKKLIPNVITIQGGPSVTYYNDLIYHPAVDYILISDGEDTLPRLLDSVFKNKTVDDIPGLIWKKNGEIVKNPGAKLTTNFLAYPMLDYDLYYEKYPTLRNKKTKPFIMNRGCPFSCTYCGSAAINQYFRNICQSSHSRNEYSLKVLDEIKYVKEKYGLNWVQFYDANLNTIPQKCKDFLKVYAKNKMPPFIGYLRTELVDEEMVRLLKEAGCDRVSIGIQTGSKRIRKDLSGRGMQTDENIMTTLNLLNKYGIRINIDIIFGWPTENFQDIMDTVILLSKLPYETISTDILIFYPDTFITQYALKNKLLTKKKIDVFNLHSMWLYGKTLLADKTYEKFILNINDLLTHVLKYKLYKNKKLLKWTLSLPSNSFFHLFKDMPFVFRSMKYDAKTYWEKLLVFYNHFKKITTHNYLQNRLIKKAEKIREEIIFYKKKYER